MLVLMSTILRINPPLSDLELSFVLFEFVSSSLDWLVVSGNNFLHKNEAIQPKTIIAPAKTTDPRLIFTNAACNHNKKLEHNKA